MSLVRLTALAGLLCLGACTKSADDIRQESKLELLRALPQQVIIPAYRNFAAEIATLNSGIDRYCAGGREGGELRVPREYWRTAMTAWQETAAYAFGPIARYDLPALINYQPIRNNKIHYWFEAGRAATAEEIKNYSVQGKGLGALEYLLFEPGMEKERTKAQYCAYLRSLTADLDLNAQRILQLLQQAPAPTPGEEAQQMLDELLNALLQTAETIKDEKLGVVLGKKSTAAPQADKAESWRSGHSVRNVRANIVSIQALFYGTTGPPSEPDPVTSGGLRSYLRKTGQPEVAAALEQTLQKLIQELDLISNSTLQNALHAQPAAVEMIYQDVAALCRILETAVLPAFDVQPGFNAKDGD